MKFKLWIDDVRPTPDGYFTIRSVRDFVNFIDTYGISNVDFIDIDHDAGEYAKFGGDYIRCLDYLYSIDAKDVQVRIHSQNPVGVQNMRRIIERNSDNGWCEII